MGVSTVDKSTLYSRIVLYIYMPHKSNIAELLSACVLYLLIRKPIIILST